MLRKKTVLLWKQLRGKIMDLNRRMPQENRLLPWNRSSESIVQAEYVMFDCYIWFLTYYNRRPCYYGY